ncbi:MAG: hypothetical protein WA376_17730, partial [Terrimicrobiaceae bacterium]
MKSRNLAIRFAKSRHAIRQGSTRLRTPYAKGLNAGGDGGRRKTHQSGDAPDTRNFPSARLEGAKQITLFEFFKLDGIKNLSRLRVARVDRHGAEVLTAIQTRHRARKIEFSAGTQNKGALDYV